MITVTFTPAEFKHLRYIVNMHGSDLLARFRLIETLPADIDSTEQRRIVCEKIVAQEEVSLALRDWGVGYT